MAQKFNNGQTFGEIRKILNGNADEINANKTAVQTAQTTATEAQKAAQTAQATATEAKTEARQVADGTVWGRVVSAGFYGNIPDVEYENGYAPSQVWNTAVDNGFISYNQGRGIVRACSFKSEHGVTQENLLSLCIHLTRVNTKRIWMVGFTFKGVVQNKGLNFPFLDGINEFTAEDPLNCIVAGREVITVWRNRMGIAYLDGTDLIWDIIGGSSDYTLPVASASTLGGVKVGAGLRIENGVLTTVSQTTVDIADDLIRSRFSEIYAIYNNSAPSQQVSAIRDILAYEGNDVVKNALKYLANFFRLSLVEYPSDINPLSANGKDGKEDKDGNGK